MYKTLDNFIAYFNTKRSGSSASADAYYRDIARFIEYLERNNIKSFEDVGKIEAMDYITELRSGKITKGKISNSTYSRNLSALRSFYRYLMESHIVIVPKHYINICCQMKNTMIMNLFGHLKMLKVINF